MTTHLISMMIFMAVPSFAALMIGLWKDWRWLQACCPVFMMVGALLWSAVAFRTRQEIVELHSVKQIKRTKTDITLVLDNGTEKVYTDIETYFKVTPKTKVEISHFESIFGDPEYRNTTLK